MHKSLPFFGRLNPRKTNCPQHPWSTQNLLNLNLCCFHLLSPPSSQFSVLPVLGSLSSPRGDVSPRVGLALSRSWINAHPHSWLWIPDPAQTRISPKGMGRTAQSHQHLWKEMNSLGISAHNFPGAEGRSSWDSSSTRLCPADSVRISLSAPVQCPGNLTVAFNPCSHLIPSAQEAQQRAEAAARCLSHSSIPCGISTNTAQGRGTAPFPPPWGRNCRFMAQSGRAQLPHIHPSLLSSQLLGSDRNNSSKIVTGEGKPGITNPEQ